MRVVSISEVKNLENKEPIPSIQAFLFKVWDYKTGEGEYGPYSFQNGSLKDASGEMKVVFSNKDNMKGMLNREILIKSFLGDKGMSGIMADDNTYKGATTRQIKVTATADISIVDGGAASSTPSSPASPKANVKTYAPSPKDVAHQWSQATKLALDTVQAIKDEHMPKMTPEQYQALVSGLVIYFDRTGVTAGMPLPSVKSGAEQAATEGFEPPF